MRRWRRGKPVAILGCGPAGIFAAHAIALTGRHPFTIFSNKRRSEMFGAQYLHESIPGLSRSSFRVEYQLRGTVEDYAEKVYGNRQQVVSPVTVESGRAWDIREAYYKGYELYESRIEHEPHMDAEMVRQIADVYQGYVISTIPLPTLCQNRVAHAFSSTRIYAVGDAPERGVRCAIRMPENTVVCNGDKEPGWYRAATILGYSTVEWPGDRRPPYDDVAAVTKPISTTCSCLPQVLRLGRYGTWTKGVLSHEAYWNTVKEF